VAIRIQHASEHNLREVDVEFGDGLTVVTGVSGSGKTSLVFDTLFHEARRRLLETLSLGAHSRRLSPARVESITGLGPAVAVGQNLLNRNPASTLATASGLHPFLRLLYTHYGERRCAHCGSALVTSSDDEVVERLTALAAHSKLEVYAPLVRAIAGSHRTLIQLLTAQFGAPSLRVDGQPWHERLLDAQQTHTIEVRVVRLRRSAPLGVARQALEEVQALGALSLIAKTPDTEYSLSFAPVCAQCGTWFSNLIPTHFHTVCPHCGGKGCSHCDATGLHPEAAAVRFLGLRLPELLALSVARVSTLMHQADLPSTAARLRAEVTRRLDTLSQVGLGYLTLDRTAPTLSRGEAQRVRLAVALTSRLEDMLHVLDEPTIGLHPADVSRLLPVFRQLGGPVVYVEHDRVAAAEADAALDIGPGAGSAGGQAVFSGTPAGLWKADTPTGRYFSLRERVTAPPPRALPRQFLTIRGADLRNLRDIDVPIPIGRLTVISGVSGSGKSTFVEDVLVTSLNAGEPVGCAEIEGPLLKPVLVDQDPIGLNPRSNPATYTKLADVIRDCFARQTGLTPSHFSFNRPEGACPACSGMGAVEVKMRYLPSTWVPCSECEGQRFTDEVLAARVDFSSRRLSVADFYNLPIGEARTLLLENGWLGDADRRTAARILEALCDVGLGYLTLGQPSPTLSGGEAQRVKLARFLGQRSLVHQLLVLDEPSTGLHPQDVSGLLLVLHRLAHSGATVVVVEHNTDIIRAADWVIDLGPGAGEEGGQLLFAGTPQKLLDARDSLTAQALREEADLQPHRSQGLRQRERSAAIRVQHARIHNLKDVSVDFPKGKLTVVTGVSGSGKTSLVHDVLEAEAQRRYLESLSMYERQSTHEGPEADVETVSGLGVALSIGPERSRFDRRATVGSATEIIHHLAVLFSSVGQRHCLSCGALMLREGQWRCPTCGATAPIAESRHFSSSTYAAACLKCHGVGTLQVPNPVKLIIHPELPLIDAMYSPGFFPKGYLGKPFNGGYDELQALAGRYGFDPHRTAWNHMTPQAQHAFLYGDPQPLEVTFRSRTGRTHTRVLTFRGFYGWLGDWDTGGTYTDTVACPECGGTRLRKEYLAVTLAGHTIHALSEMTLRELADTLQRVQVPAGQSGPSASTRTALKRLRFLQQVGLGYLHLNRLSATLSAGEAQRVKLAGMLGSGLTSLTVLLDEPSRGLHPVEVDALIGALKELRDGDGTQTQRNTVIVVEHDPQIMRAADCVIDMGPGAGMRGGRLVAQGSLADVSRAQTVTGAWLRGERRMALHLPHREPRGWLEIRGARENNLRNVNMRLPLGTLTGVCGVSGSGKSTLLIDTLGRVLAPKKITSSVSREPLQPGAHEAITGAPRRVIIVDQARTGIHSPASFLGLDEPLRNLYAGSPDAHALDLSADQLGRRCDTCGGSGTIRYEMGFLPDVFTPCETCQGTGFVPEAWLVRLQGIALPEVFGQTIDQVQALFGTDPSLARPLAAAIQVGLGYLVLRQPGHALSGGEAQRLKIADELARPAREETLYLLDEPTVGQHLEDVCRLAGVLHSLADAGHTVVLIEHHTCLLAACDYLVELGPGGGPDGGQVIATGTPEQVAAMHTPTALYLREVIQSRSQPDPAPRRATRKATR
jgi:excinuclease ABC subunit A